MSITAQEKEKIYHDFYAILGNTGLTTREIYNEIVLPLPGRFLSHIYRGIKHLETEIDNKRLSDVL